MNRYINRGPQNAFIKGDGDEKEKQDTVRKNFSEKYDEYAPMVYRICALRLGNRLDAEDAMQNTFIKFFL